MTSPRRAAAVPVSPIEATGEHWFASEVVVTTTDGTFLTCVPHAMNGLLTPPHWRWVLVDELGSRYIGPAINDDPALDSLSARISDWWEARKELLHRLPLMSVSR